MQRNYFSCTIQQFNRAWKLQKNCILEDIFQNLLEMQLYLVLKYDYKKDDSRNKDEKTVSKIIK